MGDTEREAVALNAILTILPYNPGEQYRESGPDILSQFVREAQDGDPSNLQEFVDGNCQYAPFIMPDAEAGA